MKYLVIAALTLMLGLAAQADHHGQRHGETRPTAEGLEAWSESRGQWVSAETFWLDFAEQRGGLTWGQGSEYPAYREVSEHDLFLVDTAQGPCLMEFFHERWRRANDVRRWDDAFNEHAGCPHVFD